MKQLISFLLILGLILSGCQPNVVSTGVEALDEINEFEIEDKASLTMSVYDKKFGEKIVSSWNDTYPKYKNILNYEVVNRNKQINLSDYDLISVDYDKVPLIKDQILELDESFNAHLSEESIAHLTEVINQEQIAFIPVSYDGLLFAYNETLLKELGVNVKNKHDGLPEAIDSFEKIMDLKKNTSKKKAKKHGLEYMFSFPLNDLNTMLIFLQSETYNYIDGFQGEDIILDERFKTALENLEDLGAVNWSYKEKNKNLKWDFERVLEQQVAPFTMVGNWMFYEQYEKQKDYNLRFSRMPTFKEHQLKPFTTISGFVVHKDTEFPNAAQAVLKHIRSLEGLQATLDAKHIPVVDPKVVHDSDIKISENDLDQLIAFSYSQVEPLQAFSQNASVRAWDLFVNVDIREELANIFSHQSSVNKNYKSIIKKYEKWLKKNKIKVEVDIDVDDNKGQGKK